jgi:hypothetical protein
VFSVFFQDLRANPPCRVQERGVCGEERGERREEKGGRWPGYQALKPLATSARPPGEERRETRTP